MSALNADISITSARITLPSGSKAKGLYMSQSVCSRRVVLKRGIIGIATLPALTLMTGAVVAAVPVKLAESDSMAVALAYVSNAAHVDVKKNSMFKAGQNCANCLQYKGKAGEPLGTCTLFPGKLVAADGWCKVWAKKQV